MFWELSKKANCVCSTINAQGLFISLFWLSPAANIIQLYCWHCPKLHTNCWSTPHNYFFLVCDDSGQPPEAIVAIRTQDLLDHVYYRWPRSTYRPTIDRYIGWLSVDYRLAIDRLSVDSRPIVDQQSTNSRPIVDRYIDR